MREKLLNIWKRYWFVIVILVAIIAKQWLVSQLPISARDAQGVDQWKMLTRAEGLLNGNYWEAYSTEAIFKRDVLFPFFLALCHICNISYLSGFDILYTVCSLIALYSFSHYCKNKYVLVLAFLVLEFSPISYCMLVQDVYNIGLVAPLGIGAMASLIIAYNKRDNAKSFLLWSVLTGAFTMCIWLNREDSQWLLILIAVYIIVAALSMTERKKKSIKEKVGYYICVFLPLLMIAAGDLSLCAANYNQYGVWVTNDHIATGFADAYNSLLKIQPETYPESCSITHDMIERAMEVSPAFTELKEYIEKEYEGGVFLKVGRAPEDGEVEDGWMPFVLRNSAAAAGYYKDAVSTDKYWQTVSDEIEAAFEEGKLEERSIFLFGSMLKHPWVEGQGYFSKWMTQWGNLLFINLGHEWAEAELEYSVIDSDIIKRYEAMTYNNAVEAPVYKVQGNGWIFMEDGTEFRLRVENAEGEILQYIEWMASDDIQEAFSDKFDISLSNRRFAIDCECDSEEELFLTLYDSDVIYQRIALTGVGQEELVQGVQWALDKYEMMQVLDPAEKDARAKVDVANGFVMIYNKLSWIMLGISGVAYVWLCAKLIGNIKKRITDNRILSLWLYMTAIIGCILVYTGALAYIVAFMFGGIGYTVPTTGWVDLLNAVGIVGFAILLTDYRKSKTCKIEEMEAE